MKIQKVCFKNSFGLIIELTWLDLCSFLSWFRGEDFFTVKNDIIEDLYFSQKQWFKVETS